jgi:anaerobic glycerol-3-phosphate dehydrogenase B subunit
MLREEPLLNPQILRCFRVPDGAADSFLASEANAASAREYGAQALNYHEVRALLRSGGRIVGASCHDLVKDEEVEIHAGMVVNAAGAWAGKIAALGGVEVQILPGKGTMVAINHRPVNTILNRCKLPADGDIIVPIHTVAVIGTTDVQIPDPDRIAIEPWEIQLMLEEGEKVIPGLTRMRMLRAWAGVRPLYQETRTAESRDISRAYVLLDHAARDGVEGLVTITSGKWTTYRLMAEVTVDLVCQKLGVERPCLTQQEALPGAGGGYHFLGARLAEIEEAGDYDAPVCECELATRADIVASITTGQARTLDDIRRDVRLGMGPCQGGFCTYRAAGILHSLRRPPVAEINVALRDFLQERWKGLLPVLWGQQLRQERLDELIYLAVLNADHLPGPRASRLAAEMYSRPAPGISSLPDSGPFSGQSRPAVTGTRQAEKATAPGTRPPPRYEVMVIGAGLAGLVAGWQAAGRGLRTLVMAKGWGATHWHAGCIDVLGYGSPGDENPVENPAGAVEQLISQNPGHPYAIAGLEALAESLEAFKALCAQAGYPLRGSLESNWLLPSALGTARPTCLAPETMVAGDLRRRDPMLLVGFEQLLDFFPELAAENLSSQGVLANAVTLDLPSLRKRRFVYPSILARLFEDPGFRAEVVAALKPRLGQSQRVGFPAVLGLRSPLEVKNDLEEKLGAEVFEIPGLPPSIPGIRLHDILVAAIERAGGRVYNGMQALSAEMEDGRVLSVWSEAGPRQKQNRAVKFILATGGILGGGYFGTHQGELRETIFGLPLEAPESRDQWFSREFLDPLGHPLFQSGLRVDASFRPLDGSGQARFGNLFAAGTGLAGADFLQERSFEGVALATGFKVGNLV